MTFNPTKISNHLIETLKSQTTKLKIYFKTLTTSSQIQKFTGLYQTLALKTSIYQVQRISSPKRSLQSILTFSKWIFLNQQLIFRMTQSLGIKLRLKKTFVWNSARQPICHFTGMLMGTTPLLITRCLTPTVEWSTKCLEPNLNLNPLVGGRSTRFPGQKLRLGPPGVDLLAVTITFKAKRRIAIRIR